MRNYTENTWANALKEPLVLGVSLTGLLFVIFLVVSIQLLTGGSNAGNIAAAVAASIGYGVLRILARYAKNSWEAEFTWHMERLANKEILPAVQESDCEITTHSPDTLDQDAQCSIKLELKEKIDSIAAGKSVSYCTSFTKRGAKVSGIENTNSHCAIDQSLEILSGGKIKESWRVYSLWNLPYSTNPLWLHSELPKSQDLCIFLRLDGLDKFQIKKQMERSRRSHAQSTELLSNIDSEVSFSEASTLLDGLSRGEENLVGVSLVIASPEEISLDPYYFVKEKNKRLAIASITGVRRRPFRSFRVRSVTASDLFPSFLDPMEEGSTYLSTSRGSSLYFTPLDKRLEALHCLVVGASGSGKSFFVGLLLKRIIQEGEKISVMFLDHNRSFRRFVNQTGKYFEPQSAAELSRNLPDLFHCLSNPGSLQGIELSDLSLSEKKESAKQILTDLEAYLRSRKTFHPVYVVIDECWNFLRDEPVLVQRAFREYRKLNGAVVAITQSLGDFLNSANGQSILQNAPIRILLRQGEDVTKHQSTLNLNDHEVRLVKYLRQVKGKYSECLITTPYLSRLARMVPTEEEHELLRTDNLREEMVLQALGGLR